MTAPESRPATDEEIAALIRSHETCKLEFCTYYDQGDPCSEASLVARIDSLRAAAQERDRQIAELKGLLNALMEHHPKRSGWSEPPGHSHLVAGIWNPDNGAKAGTKCEWCATWWAARAALKPESKE